VHVLFDATVSAVALRAAIGFVAAVAIAALGVRHAALTRSGAVATVVVGVICVALGGVPVAAALILFFASGSLLSRVTSDQAERARGHAQKQGRRDATQVFANGGIATAFAIVAGGLQLSGHDPLVSLAASIGALAAASGDTWSTELGSLFGGTPRSIASFQPVEAGTSGGVTLVGLLGAEAGGAFVGLAGLLAPRPGVSWIGLATLAGVAGSLIDSVLGATLQASWRCPRCERILEGPQHEPCGVPATLVRGWAWLDNDAVNLLATVCGALVAIALVRA
jgi:uncharacterized protein (TIGR00297 family)